MSPVTPMAAQALAEAVVEKLLAADEFSRWLGLEVVKIAPGLAIVRMTVRPEMVNGFGTSHGGIVYSLADSALAFATNASGFLSVAIDCSLSYPKAVRPGDVLTATAIEQSTANRLGFCAVDVMDQTGAFVGHFRGTVYRTLKAHFPGDEGGAPSDGGQPNDQQPSQEQLNREQPGRAQPDHGH